MHDMQENCLVYTTYIFLESQTLGHIKRFGTLIIFPKIVVIRLLVKLLNFKHTNSNFQHIFHLSKISYQLSITFPHVKYIKFNNRIFRSPFTGNQIFRHAGVTFMQY